MRKAHGRHLRLVGGRPLPMPQGPRLKPAPGGRQTADDAASATRPAADARAVRAAGYEFDGAVMITASHLPYNRNGFKFFTRDGGFEKADIAVLLKAAAAEHAAAEAPNLDPAGAYQDDAFVLSCALHSSPALIEYVRSPCSAESLCHSCVFLCARCFSSLLAACLICKVASGTGTAPKHVWAASWQRGSSPTLFLRRWVRMAHGPRRSEGSLTRAAHAAQVDFMPVYAAHLRSIIQKGISHPSNYERPLEGFHVIVDAGALIRVRVSRPAAASAAGDAGACALGRLRQAMCHAKWMTCWGWE